MQDLAPRRSALDDDAEGPPMPSPALPSPAASPAAPRTGAVPFLDPFGMIEIVAAG